MTVFSVRFPAVSSGTAGETGFGTAVTTVLPTGDRAAKRVLGLVVSGVDPTYTAEEGAAGIVRLTSNSLSLPAQSWVTGPYTTSGPATNSSGQGMAQEIIPLDLEAQGGETVSLDIAPTVTITTARLYEVALLYADAGGAPRDWKDKFPLPVAMKGALTDTLSQLTTTRTALADLTIPAWAKEIVATKSLFTKSGAITAGQEVIGFIEATFPGVKDKEPQEFPTNSIGATLGVPVGVGQYHEFVPWIPTYIPLPIPRTDITLRPQVNLRTAVSTANNVTFCVGYR